MGRLKDNGMGNTEVAAMSIKLKLRRLKRFILKLVGIEIIDHPDWSKYPAISDSGFTGDKGMSSDEWDKFLEENPEVSKRALEIKMYLDRDCEK